MNKKSCSEVVCSTQNSFIINLFGSQIYESYLSIATKKELCRIIPKYFVLRITNRTKTNFLSPNLYSILIFISLYCGVGVCCKGIAT